MIQRAFHYFSSQCHLAMSESVPQVALDAYESAYKLLSTAALDALKVEGYRVSGLLLPGGSLRLCYRGNKEMVLKVLDIGELARVFALQEKLPEGGIPHVTPFSLHKVVKRDETVMIMPKFAQCLMWRMSLSSGLSCTKPLRAFMVLALFTQMLSLQTFAWTTAQTSS